jgi:hypothetical protein
MTKTGAFVSVIAFVGAAGLSGAAHAQSIASKFTCQNIGRPSIEQFGAEAGQSLQEVSFSCSVSDGLLKGGAMTATFLWLIQGTDRTLLSGQGAVRSPDGILVFQHQEGKFKIEMKDGKPSGWSASGRGRYVAASGAAAAVNGKTYRSKASPTGPMSYVVEFTVE